MTKRIRKTTKGKKKAVEETKSAQPPSPAFDKKDELDFGGLPNFDLKRNLGCG